MGNAQLVFVVLAAVALLAFERGRHALGGLLLAYAMVGKLYPRSTARLSGDPAGLAWPSAGRLGGPRSWRS